MTAKRTSIWKRDQAERAAGKVLEMKPAPKFPPDPLDASDGWPRVIVVRYMEPNPLAPDDPSQAIERVSWSILGDSDMDAAALLAQEASLLIMQQARNAHRQTLAAAGSRMREIEAHIAAQGTPDSNGVN